jgi:hypothetical protein
MVLIDASLIGRVFVNILGNAVKFSPNNAKIIVSVDDADVGKVAVSITDAGHGLPPDKISQVFDKFVQIGSVSSGSIRSTGLGLAFCKMAIEAHGNKIGVESIPDQFTRFWFTLDKADGEPPIPDPLTEKSQLKEEITFSAEELEYLIGLNETMRTLHYYQTGSVIAALESLDESNCPNIGIWKKEMEKAVYTGNEPLFNRLINMILNPIDEKDTHC